MDNQHDDKKMKATAEQSQAGLKPPRRLNRPLATCTACRRRRTRCDRLLPCSECIRRRISCDYTGAVRPSLAATRCRNDANDRDHYIRQLETRIYELEKTRYLRVNGMHDSQIQCSNEKSLGHVQHEGIDPRTFYHVSEDLAYQIAQLALGARATIRSQSQHPLEVQIQKIIAAENQRPPEANFLSSSESSRLPISHKYASSRTTNPQVYTGQWEEFRMDFNSKLGPHTLNEVLEIFPTQKQFELTSDAFFCSLNLWMPMIHEKQFKQDAQQFWAQIHEKQFKQDTQQFWAQTVAGSLCFSSNPSELHFIAIILAIAGHGLLRLDPSPELFVTTEEERNWLANAWFKASLKTLVLSDIFSKPSIHGIRALGLLCSVEIPAENLDHAFFFWSLTASLAGLIGLYNEPPGLDIENVSEEELESRRQLTWCILSFDWGGNVISGVVRQPIDPDSYAVKLPGVVALKGVAFHPVDKWPLEPTLSMRRAYAISNKVMQKITLKLFGGKPVQYTDLLEMEQYLVVTENLVPERLRLVLEDDKTLNTLHKLDPLAKLYCYYFWSHFVTSRIRIHRPLIDPKLTVSRKERLRHAHELSQACTKHILISKHYPRSLLMYPLVLYGLMHTASAVAVAVLTDPDMLQAFDLRFFMPELHNLQDTFKSGSDMSSSSLVRRSGTILQIFIEKIEEADYARAYRFKKGPLVPLTESNHWQNEKTQTLPRKIVSTSRHRASSVGSSHTEETNPAVFQYEGMKEKLDSIMLFPRSGPTNPRSPRVAKSRAHSETFSPLVKHDLPPQPAIMFSPNATQMSPEQDMLNSSSFSDSTMQFDLSPDVCPSWDIDPLAQSLAEGSFPIYQSKGQEDCQSLEASDELWESQSSHYIFPPRRASLTSWSTNSIIPE